MSDSNEADGPGPLSPPVTPPSPEDLPPPETGDSSLETYHTITGMVGGPSIRLRDNMVSLIGTVLGLIVGAITGVLTCGPNAPLPIGFTSGMSTLVGVAICAVLGAVLGVFLSGFILMVLGLMRR